MLESEKPLRPATPEELAFTLRHALLFKGKKHWRHADGMMADITAEHLIEQLRMSGFVVMKGPPVPMHETPATPKNPHLTK